MTATPSRAAGEGCPSRASITPMCVTMWNQDSPYNDLCPLYHGDRSVTGCVATAMAQEITFSGALQAGEVGKEYFMMLYNGNTQICEQQPRFTIGTLTGIEGVGCDSDISSVEIYNASGVKVAVGTDIDSAESLLPSTLPSGIYIYIYYGVCSHRRPPYLSEIRQTIRDDTKRQKKHKFSISRKLMFLLSFVSFISPHIVKILTFVASVASYLVKIHYFCQKLKNQK